MREKVSSKRLTIDMWTQEFHVGGVDSKQGHAIPDSSTRVVVPFDGLTF